VVELLVEELDELGDVGCVDEGVVDGCGCRSASTAGVRTGQG
jgi:hypothetical protein